MKILFLSAWFPYPPINGAKIRIYNLIRQLSKKHEITLLAFAQTIPINMALEHIPELEKYCQLVKVVPARMFIPKGFSAYKGIFSLQPRSVIQTYSDEMAELVQSTVQHVKYDVVIASEVYAPSLVSLLASNITGVPKILDALEISLVRDAYRSETRPGMKLRHGLTWQKLRRFTRDMLRKSDACTVPSLQEKRNLQELGSDAYLIEVVPHSLDMEQYQQQYDAAEPNSLVFTGSFTYYANLDAVKYFLRDIYPAIQNRESNVKLKIIGNINGFDPKQYPSYESITFTGLLQDVRPEVARSWLSIVPLRVGAGTRLKIIESMALGTPVISTSKGAEGLEVTSGENIIIADTPGAFSQAVLDVLYSPSLRQRLSLGGRNLVSEKYSSDVMGEKFNLLMEHVVRLKRDSNKLK